jgi:hypothetical protein
MFVVVSNSARHDPFRLILSALSRPDSTTLTRSSEGTLQGDGVTLDALDGVVGDNGLSVLQDGRNINLLPYNRYFGSREDRLDRLGDFCTDT